jgi:NADH-quinone oxidoreductase subunit N
VNVQSFEPTMILAILPEILLLALAGIVLLLDAVWAEEQKRNLGWVTTGGLAFIMVISLLVAVPGTDSRAVFGGMVQHDWLGFAFKMLFIFSAAITAMFAMDHAELGMRGEFYVLMLISVIGMNLMASAGDIVMLYIAIETTSIPLYILAGFLRKDAKSTESGFKYFLFGAFTSTVMLYGFSLLFGLTGTTSLEGINGLLGTTGMLPMGMLLGSLMLILVGFSFKISAVPFHFWAPDVYEGAPTPVAGFLSTASKAAGFAVLLRVLFVVFTPAGLEYWPAVLAALAVVTMTLGNLVALTQKNIKRLLAYSSIAHAGYILIGFVSWSLLGMTSVVFYLIAYLLTNLAAFGVVTTVSRITGNDEIASYAGLSRRSPALGLVMLVSFLSLAGMPPLGGFIAKIFVFAAAVQSGYIWLAFIGVINSIFGLYYYLTVLKVVYLYRSDEEDKPLQVSRPYALALGVLSFGIILIGTLFGPWYAWASSAAASLF